MALTLCFKLTVILH